MLINVPQYIDVEDKVAGPLTMKQLGWLIGLGIILLILWNVLPGIPFFIVGLPVTLVFLALAFYKPYGQPLGSFVIFAILYFFRPKVYVWRRTPEKEQATPKIIKKTDAYSQDKKLTHETLSGLAQLLDSEGTYHDEKIVQILKTPAKK